MIVHSTQWVSAWPIIVVVVHYVLVLYFVGRVMLRPYREPASRIAWMLLILAVPVFGMVIYVLLGETNVGAKRAQRMHEVRESLIERFKASHMADLIPTAILDTIPERFHQVFRIGQSVNGFAPVAGNRADLTRDSASMIDDLVADIDAATQHVHLLFYIWLADESGLKVAHALIRAAQRGVVCRVLVDALGSRALMRSPHWQEMRTAGVQQGVALSVGNPFLRVLYGRIDLRNHRKIMVIDNAITYCGSQNCADAAFTPKAKFAPWVDTVVRFTGPIVFQNQLVFISDWEATTGERLDLLDEIDPSIAHETDGFPAQVIATGPTERHSAMSDVFMKLIDIAQHELIITTPYFVPNEAIMNALCVAARCGTQVTLIVPRRNDSWIVAAASRSYYRTLVQAGVRIFEYNGGLLHAKLLTIDGEVTLIGSANMDRRSFELNYENNIALYDRTLTQSIIARQNEYIAASTPVTLDDIDQWRKPKLLWYNTVATMGPVL